MDGAVEWGSPSGTPRKGSRGPTPSLLLLFCLPRESFGEPQPRRGEGPDPTVEGRADSERRRRRTAGTNHRCKRSRCLPAGTSSPCPMHSAAAARRHGAVRLRRAPPSHHAGTDACFHTTTATSRFYSTVLLRSSTPPALPAATPILPTRTCIGPPGLSLLSCSALAALTAFVKDLIKSLPETQTDEVNSRFPVHALAEKAPSRCDVWIPPLPHPSATGPSSTSPSLMSPVSIRISTSVAKTSKVSENKPSFQRFPNERLQARALAFSSSGPPTTRGAGLAPAHRAPCPTTSLPRFGVGPVPNPPRQKSPTEEAPKLFRVKPGSLRLCLLQPLPF